MTTASLTAPHFEAIEAAAAELSQALPVTPFVRSPHLSNLTGADVWLKLENRQETGSFKERGALIKLRSLDRTAAARGVIAVSAGNHAQAVACHARRLGIPATVVMPLGTPFSKVRRTRSFGGRVMLRGANLAEAEEAALALASDEHLTMIHPYADPLVVAGQGTVGLEMLRVKKDLDTLIVPVGGGGLIAGIAIAASTLRPGMEIVGVQATRQPHMQRSLLGLEPVFGAPTVADGIAVETQTPLTLETVRRFVTDIVLISDDAIESAICDLLDNEKLLVEGAGAATVAALCVHANRFAGKKVGLVLTGGNIDAGLLANIIVRTQLRWGLVARIRVEITDKPGALAQIATLIAAAEASVVDLAHQRLFNDLSSRSADLDFTLELRYREDVAVILQRLNDAGFPSTLLPPQSRA